MNTCKLTKVQQAVEDRILAKLDAIQRFKMSDLCAALIYGIQSGELPKPPMDRYEKYLEAKQNVSNSAPTSRCPSAASGPLDVTPGTSSIDPDTTPKADDQHPLWNDALQKIEHPNKTSKKHQTAKTRKKKKLSKPETEAFGRELQPEFSTVVKAKIPATAVPKKVKSNTAPVGIPDAVSNGIVTAPSGLQVTNSAEAVQSANVASKYIIATTTVVKSKLVADVAVHEAQINAVTVSSSKTVELTSSKSSVSALSNVAVVAQSESVTISDNVLQENLILEDDDASTMPSPPKQVRRSSRTKRSISSPPRVSPVVIEEIEDLKLDLTPEPPEPVPEVPLRKSKRSLVIDNSQKSNTDETASPQVRRSRLAESVPPSLVKSEVAIVPDNKDYSLRSSKSKSAEKLTTMPGMPPKEDEQKKIESAPDDNADLSDDTIDNDDGDGDGDETETETETEQDSKSTPVREGQLQKSGSITETSPAAATAEIREQGPAEDELKPVNTRPITKPTRSEAKTAGPEADQQIQQNERSTRTRVKNAANRPESRQAGPDDQNNGLVIPSASALAEAEKAMKNYGKPAKPTAEEKPGGESTGVPRTTFVKKPAAGFGNIPPSAQKQPIRMGTPMKNTAAKKQLQPATQTIVKNAEIASGLATAGASKALRAETPQQKSTAPVMGTAPVPFGSGGAPSKPKLMPTATKNPSRPNSPIGGLNKMPIAMGLAGAVALGKIPAATQLSTDDKTQQPSSSSDPKPKYDNLVTNVMSFVQQPHAIQGTVKVAPTAGVSQKLASSTSSSALQKAAGTTTMGTTLAKAKADTKALANKAPNGKGLASSGVSQSKLPVPVSNSKPPATTLAPPQVPPPPPPVQPKHAVAEENSNACNSTYTKLMDSTIAMFDVSRFDDTYTDYPIDDVKPCGDDDDEEEDLKPIPDWASGARLAKRLQKQHQLDSRIRRRLEMDEDLVNIEGIDEALVNPDRPANRIRPRTSSQHWTTPPLLKSKSALKGKSPQKQ